LLVVESVVVETFQLQDQHFRQVNDQRLPSDSAFLVTLPAHRQQVFRSKVLLK
jgi:hypothetical protein